MPLNVFLDNCDSGALIDYDGFAVEVILNECVISNELFRPRQLNYGIREQLINIQQKHGPITIVWYNK